MAEENQGVAVEAAQEEAQELDAQAAQEDFGDPPVSDVPEDAIEDEDEGVNPPDGVKENKGSKRTRQDEEGGPNGS